MPATVILKFDDLHPGNLPGFCRVAELTQGEGCPAGFGVLGRGFSAPEGVEELCRAMAAWDSLGIEIWNHGLRHAVPEFSEGTYDEQKHALAETQRLVRERCGITMTTFGSPFNNANETTVKVLNECFPEITCALLLKDFDLPSRLSHLTARCNYEVTTGTVSYEAFCASYEKKRDASYLVLQGHPGKWTDDHLADFRKILRLLRDDGCRFLTPRAYASELQKKSV